MRLHWVRIAHFAASATLRRSRGQKKEETEKARSLGKNDAA